MQEVEITWGRVITVWWSIAWRAILVFTVGLFPFALIAAIFEWDSRIVQAISSLLSLLGFWFGMKKALGLRYSNFRVCLVAIPADDLSSPEISTNDLETSNGGQSFE